MRPARTHGDDVAAVQNPSHTAPRTVSLEVGLVGAGEADEISTGSKIGRHRARLEAPPSGGAKGSSGRRRSSLLTRLRRIRLFAERFPTPRQVPSASK